MGQVTFADVVHTSVSFSQDDPAGALVLRLIDTPWFQRLRDISQTANTRLVYMFSEHSRFGHCLGVAYMACQLIEKLAIKQVQVKDYKVAVSVAALLHDIGHLAPGSHIAQKVWFPEKSDEHEQIAVRILSQADTLVNLLNSYSSDLLAQVQSILLEKADVPPWTWQIISGGGWNVDRGNWCIVDSILAGVSYGKYNIPALTDSIVLTPDLNLSLRENRLDAMMHFAVSRHAMYRQLYQHRVLLTADHITKMLVKRARELTGTNIFADETMRSALQARQQSDLTLSQIYWMREAWWRYHLFQWSQSSDSILSDLSKRLLERRLFKTIRIRSVDNESDLLAQAGLAMEKCGYDPNYYLKVVSTMDVHQGDSRQSMLVTLDDGRQRALIDSDPLMQVLLGEEEEYKKRWLIMPEDVKALLGRER